MSGRASSSSAARRSPKSVRQDDQRAHISTSKSAVQRHRRIRSHICPSAHRPPKRRLRLRFNEATARSATVPTCHAEPSLRAARAARAKTQPIRAPVAQRIERRFPKPCVAGSSPAGGARGAVSDQRPASPGEARGVVDQALETEPSMGHGFQVLPWCFFCPPPTTNQRTKRTRPGN